jgi:hypothetical protein
VVAVVVKKQQLVELSEEKPAVALVAAAVAVSAVLKSKNKIKSAKEFFKKKLRKINIIIKFMD